MAKFKDKHKVAGDINSLNLLVMCASLFVCVQMYPTCYILAKSPNRPKAFYQFSSKLKITKLIFLHRKIHVARCVINTRQ